MRAAVRFAIGLLIGSFVLGFGLLYVGDSVVIGIIAGVAYGVALVQRW